MKLKKCKSRKLFSMMILFILALTAIPFYFPTIVYGDGGKISQPTNVPKPVNRNDVFTVPFQGRDVPTQAYARRIYENDKPTMYYRELVPQEVMGIHTRENQEMMKGHIKETIAQIGSGDTADYLQHDLAKATGEEAVIAYNYLSGLLEKNGPEREVVIQDLYSLVICSDLPDEYVLNTIKLLKNCLQDRDLTVRVEAAITLTNFGEKNDVLDVLVEGLAKRDALNQAQKLECPECPDTTVLYITPALGRIGNWEAVTKLEQIVNDEGEYIYGRLAAAEGLISLGKSKEALPIVLQSVEESGTTEGELVDEDDDAEEDNKWVRLYGLKILSIAAKEDSTLYQAIKKVSEEDSDDEVRENAIELLGGSK